jgi:hypothetical protein
MEKRELS